LTAFYPKGEKMENKFIEYGDFYQQERRILTASSSLKSWYKKRHGELVKKHVSILLSAAKEGDRAKRAALDREAAEVKKEIDLIDEQMWSCRLANLKGEGAEITSISATEKRLAPAVTSMPMQRIFDTSDKEQKSGRKKLNGVASVYGKETNISGYFLEEIVDGAFLRVLDKKPDVRLLFNHDPNFIFGRTTNKTLRLNDVSRIGLVFWCDLPDDIFADVLFSRVERQDVSGCSFAFIVGLDDWILPLDKRGLPKRFIKEIDELLDVGPVTYPAYERTDVVAILEQERLQSFEDFLMEEDREWEESWQRNKRFTDLQKRLSLKA